MNFIKLIFLVSSVLIMFGCGKSPFLKTLPKKSSDSANGRSAISTDLSLKNHELNITPYWKEGPFIGDESKLIIVVTNNKGLVTDIDGEFKIKLWMPDMNHGSYPVTIERVNTGVFEIRDIYFSMEGYWDLHFDFFKNEQLVEEAKWGITL